MNRIPEKARDIVQKQKLSIKANMKAEDQLGLFFTRCGMTTAACMILHCALALAPCAMTGAELLAVWNMVLFAPNRSGLAK